MALNEIIVEVHIQVCPSHWSDFPQRLETALREHEETSAVPLYFSNDLEDLEVRACFVVRDLRAFDSIVVNRIRQLTGVTGTRVRLTVTGHIFAGGLERLLASEQSFWSWHVFVRIVPGEDSAAWESLLALHGQGEVLPVWIFRDYYEYDRDLTLRVIGPNAESIRLYLEPELGKCPGIAGWTARTMYKSVLLKKPEELWRIAAPFLSRG